MEGGGAFEKVRSSPRGAGATSLRGSRAGPSWGVRCRGWGRGCGVGCLRAAGAPRSKSGRPRRNTAVSYSTAARYKQIETMPRFARYHDTAVQSKKPSSACLYVRKTTLTSVLLCANGTDIHVVRVTKKNRDDLEEPGRLSFLARRRPVPFGELVLRRDLVPELFPPPSAGFLLRRVRVGIRQRCFRTS